MSNLNPSEGKLTTLTHFAYKCSENVGTSSVNYRATRASKLIPANKLYYEDLKKNLGSQPTHIFEYDLLSGDKFRPQAGAKNQAIIMKECEYFLISNFRRVLKVVCFLLGDSPTSEFYMPTFRNTVSSS